jgi:hypothetical protein
MGDPHPKEISVPQLPAPVIAALEAFAAPDSRDAVHSLADVGDDDRDRLAALLESVEWVDMGVVHPMAPELRDPEGVRRLLSAMGAEGRCAVLSASGSEDDRDLGGALDGVLQQQQSGGALVVCRPGPLAFLVTASGERWLLSDRELPQLTGPLPIIRS